MPMMTPYVWVGHGPDHLVECATAGEAIAQIAGNKRILVPDYQTAIRTLIMLGTTAERALELAEIARHQPESQESYVAD